MRHRLALRYERALLPDGDCAYALGVACLVVVPRWLYAPQPLIAALFLLLPLFAAPALRNLYLLSLAGGLLVRRGAPQGAPLQNTHLLGISTGRSEAVFVL